MNFCKSCTGSGQTQTMYLFQTIGVVWQFSKSFPSSSPMEMFALAGAILVPMALPCIW